MVRRGPDAQPASQCSNISSTTASHGTPPRFAIGQHVEAGPRRTQPFSLNSEPGFKGAPDFTLTLNHGRGHRQSHGFEENPCTPPRKLLHHSQSNPAAPRRPNPLRAGPRKKPDLRRASLASDPPFFDGLIPTFSCWRFAACRVCVGWIHGAKGRRRALRARTGS
jgi:hypothetical protein